MADFTWPDALEVEGAVRSLGRFDLNAPVSADGDEGGGRSVRYLAPDGTWRAVGR
jgi:hypothetical protein